jgi:hypothetical protein
VIPLREVGQRLLATARGGDAETLAGQDFLDEGESVGVVVDDQDLGAVGPRSHLDGILSCVHHGPVRIDPGATIDDEEVRR